MTTSETITAVTAFAALVGVVANIVIGVRSLRLNREAWRLNHEARSSHFKQFIYEKQYEAYIGVFDCMNRWENKRFQTDPQGRESLEKMSDEDSAEMARNIWIWGTILPTDVFDVLLTYICSLQNVAAQKDHLWLESKKLAFQDVVRTHLGIDPMMEDVSEILKTSYREAEIARREAIKARSEPLRKALRKAFDENKWVQLPVLRVTRGR